MKTMVNFTLQNEEKIWIRTDWVVAITIQDDSPGSTRLWGSGHDADYFIVTESAGECLTKLGYNTGEGQ